MMMMNRVIGKYLRGQGGDCGSAETELRDSLECLMMGKLALKTKTWLEDNLMSGRGALKVVVGLEDSRRVVVGGFLHFQGWQSKLSVVYQAQAQIGAAATSLNDCDSICGVKSVCAAFM